jgi:hypothetical protein
MLKTYPEALGRKPTTELTIHGSDGTYLHSETIITTESLRKNNSAVVMGKDVTLLTT